MHGERLRQPQLALYAHILSQQKNTPPSGVALAQVKLEECKFEELADTGLLKAETGHTVKYQEAWQAANVQWPGQLTQLANDFLAGHAAVDPIDSQVCQYCGLQPFCRIHQVDPATSTGKPHE